MFEFHLQIVAVVLKNYEVSLAAEEVGTRDRAEGSARTNLVEEILRREGRGPVAVIKGETEKLQLHKDKFGLRDPSNLTRSGHRLAIVSHIMV